MRKPNVCYSIQLLIFFTNPAHVSDYLTGKRKPVKVSFAQTYENSMVEGIYEVVYF